MRNLEKLSDEITVKACARFDEEAFWEKIEEIRKESLEADPLADRKPIKVYFESNNDQDKNTSVEDLINSVKTG